MKLTNLFFALMALSSPITAQLTMLHHIENLGGLAREPMLVEHPSGTLFLAGYGSQITGTDWTAPPLLWRSDDGGNSWFAVDVGTSEQGAQGNSDVDLAVGPDGTIYYITMGFNRQTARGTQISIGVSRDVGHSWVWHRLSTTEGDDRPWVAVSPENIAHAVWNDGKGVRHFTSEDSGQTWQELDRVNDKGGASHLAVGPGGLVAVRIGPVSASGQKLDAGVDVVAVSRDSGRTWTRHEAPAKLRWYPFEAGEPAVPRWVEPVAWGSDGKLYSLWSEGKSMWLGWSDDYGVSWTKQTISTQAGTAFYPFLKAGSARDLAASWFVSNNSELTAHLALIRPEASAISIKLSDAFTPLSWADTTEQRAPDAAGEYFPVIFLSNGNLGAATPIQDAENQRYGFTWWEFQVIQ
ncbi:MAG: exo-alpha-sialidase [Xanthomonadales bacterium]|nr:exo-alpha-sialidase [Xanthomonadales bacterium]